MSKNELIETILNFNPNLIWEIDESKYYQLIGWNGGVESYWLKYNLEVMNNKFLSLLIKELKINEYRK